MNRIILLGNGFDLAHGLNTRYTDFINDYWESKLDLFIKSYREGKLSFRSQGDRPKFDYTDKDITITNLEYISGLKIIDEPERKGYERFKYFTMRIPASQDRCFTFTNKLLEQITDKKYINNWVDIEEEYYDSLKKYYKDLEKIIILHNDFQNIQDSLEKYLQKVTNESIKTLQNIDRFIFSPLDKDDFIDTLETNENIDKIIFLNFNYTPTACLYSYGRTIRTEIIHIHGELGRKDNPIIFGYGNERDDQYKLIEKENRNELFKYIKSFRYSKNNNYRNIIRNINMKEYQIFIFGHSCGLSDSTLLSSLFEHNNCKSIKIFYYKDPSGIDNYNNTYMNISRHFSNKEKMRRIIVPQELSIAYC